MSSRPHERPAAISPFAPRFSSDSKGLDLAVISGNSAKILVGNGDGTFRAPLTVVLGPSPARVSAADVNGDGRVDLLAANNDGKVSVLINTNNGLLSLAGTTGFRVATATSTAAGAPLALTVTAVNASGNVAAGYTGTVLFASSGVQSGLPASYTFTAADAGTHTFNFTLTSAGTQSITARDAEVTTVTGSQAGIVVNPGATVKFFLTTPRIGLTGPSVSTAGVTQNFSATATDTWGNTTRGWLTVSPSRPAAPSAR